MEASRLQQSDTPPNEQGQYRDRSSFPANPGMNMFKRMDPRAILVVYPLALTLVFLLSHEVVRDFCFLAYLFISLIILGKTNDVVKWILVITAAHLPLYVMDSPGFQLHFLAIIARKVCMILCTGRILLLSISVADCINVMKKLKMGRNVIIPVAICFRFVPTLVFEAKIIRDALKVRRLYSIKAILLHPFSTFEIFLSAFLFRMFALGEELFFSLSTRGMNFTGTNFYREMEFGYRDIIFVLGTAGYILFILF